MGRVWCRFSSCNGCRREFRSRKLAWVVDEHFHLPCRHRWLTPATKQQTQRMLPHQVVYRLVRDLFTLLGRISRAIPAQVQSYSRKAFAYVLYRLLAIADRAFGTRYTTRIDRYRNTGKERMASTSGEAPSTQVIEEGGQLRSSISRKGGYSYYYAHADVRVTVIEGVGVGWGDTASSRF